MGIKGIKFFLPGQFQKHFAFPLGQHTDQSKETLLRVCQVRGYPLLTNHLGRSCKSPLSTEQNIKVD
jgi:hypothetical protein